VGFHAAWDWGETYFYSVPDSGQVFPGHLLNSSFHGPRWLSGGSVGPEGSVLLFFVIAMTWVAFDRLHREVKYAPGPPEIVADALAGNDHVGADALVRPAQPSSGLPHHE